MKVVCESGAALEYTPKLHKRGLWASPPYDVCSVCKAAMGNMASVSYFIPRENAFVLEIAHTCCAPTNVIDALDESGQETSES